MSWIFVTFKKLFKVKNKREEECGATLCEAEPGPVCPPKQAVVLYDYLPTSCVAVPSLENSSLYMLAFPSLITHELSPVFHCVFSDSDLQVR